VIDNAEPLWYKHLTYGRMAEPTFAERRDQGPKIFGPVAMRARVYSRIYVHWGYRRFSLSAKGVPAFLRQGE